MASQHERVRIAIAGNPLSLPSPTNHRARSRLVVIAGAGSALDATNLDTDLARSRPPALRAGVRPMLPQFAHVRIAEVGLDLGEVSAA